MPPRNPKKINNLAEKYDYSINYKTVGQITKKKKYSRKKMIAQLKNQ
jgi:hypothetical protein